MYGLFHARKLRLHELAIAPAGTACSRGSASRSRFYDRFTPAIAASDFALRERGRSSGRSTSWQCCA